MSFQTLTALPPLSEALASLGPAVPRLPMWYTMPEDFVKRVERLTQKRPVVQVHVPSTGRTRHYWRDDGTLWTANDALEFKMKVCADTAMGGG